MNIDELNETLERYTKTIGDFRKTFYFPIDMYFQLGIVCQVRDLVIAVPHGYYPMGSDLSQHIKVCAVISYDGKEETFLEPFSSLMFEDDYKRLKLERLEKEIEELKTELNIDHRRKHGQDDPSLS